VGDPGSEALALVSWLRSGGRPGSSVGISGRRLGVVTLSVFVEGALEESVAI